MLIKAFTDGSCLGNGGENAVGGWAATMAFTYLGERRSKEISGAITNTTNNRAELLAVIKALESVNGSHDWEITLDSKYVIDIAEGNKQPRLNLDLWNRYKDIRAQHKSVTFSWVGGHTGEANNEKCNILAQTAANQQAMFLARQSAQKEVKQEVIEELIIDTGKTKKKQLGFLKQLNFLDVLLGKRE
jgi:ribonuclease HI